MINAQVLIIKPIRADTKIYYLSFITSMEEKRNGSKNQIEKNGTEEGTFL